MRRIWWMLIGLLVVGGTLSSDADAREVSEGLQASRFERLLKQRPNDPVLHYNLGTVRYQHGRYDKAAESLSAAIASSSSSLQSRASYNLGNTHYRLGRAEEQTAPNQAIDFYQKALEDYRLAIRQDPKDADAKYNYEVVEHRLKALKAQQAQQESAKAQQQQASEQPSQAQQATAQAAQGEQAKQEQSQQAQAQQQQTGQSGESQPQQAASAESKSEPASSHHLPGSRNANGHEAAAPSARRQVVGSSKETAQGAEQQQQGQQAQVVQQQPGQQGAEQHAQMATEAQNMSQQQALWILDTLKNEERGALVKEHQGSARESDVEQDW